MVNGKPTADTKETKPREEKNDLIESISFMSGVVIEEIVCEETEREIKISDAGIRSVKYSFVSRLYEFLKSLKQKNKNIMVDEKIHINSQKFFETKNWFYIALIAVIINIILLFIIFWQKNQIDAILEKL